LQQRAGDARPVAQEADQLALPQRANGEAHRSRRRRIRRLGRHLVHQLRHRPLRFFLPAFSSGGGSATNRLPVFFRNTSSSDGCCSVSRCTRSPKRSTTFGTSWWLSLPSKRSTSSSTTGVTPT